MQRVQSSNVWLLLPPLLIELRVVSRPEVLYMVGLAMQAWSFTVLENPQSQAVPESRDGAETDELWEVDGIFQVV